MKKSYIQPSIVTILAVGGQILSGSIKVENKESDTDQYSKKNNQFSFVDDESENGWSKATSVWDK